MMKLIEKIKQDMKQAMRNKEKEKLSTLRMLLAKIEKEKIALKLADVNDLTNEQVESVIVKNIKELDKEIESYIKVGRLTTNQQSEKLLLMSYLPRQLSDEEILVEVKHAFGLVERGEIEIKGVMKYLSQKLKGKADMGTVSKLAREFQ